MLAAFVGVGGVARPEPMVGALLFVEDGLWPVGSELRAPWHGRIVQAENGKVKST